MPDGVSSTDLCSERLEALDKLVRQSRRPSFEAYITVPNGSQPATFYVVASYAAYAITCSLRSRGYRSAEGRDRFQHQWIAASKRQVRRCGLYLP